jgi:hypothetical protein
MREKVSALARRLSRAEKEAASATPQSTHESQTTLVRSESRVLLHSVAPVDSCSSLVILPDDTSTRG